MKDVKERRQGKADHPPIPVQLPQRPFRGQNGRTRTNTDRLQGVRDRPCPSVFVRLQTCGGVGVGAGAGVGWVCCCCCCCCCSSAALGLAE